MDWFQVLFDIESRAKSLSNDERLSLRQSEAQTIWDAMRAELDAVEERTEQVILPKSDLRKALRQQKAKPIWQQMEAELQALADRTEKVILPKSEFGKAINYLRNHWIELTRYLSDPKLPIDNNECEQLMRQVGLGRKNWLFAGSVVGGERNAGFLTLTSSAHRNDLDVWAYINDILQRLLAGQTNYEPMLPWNWATEHPDSIRVFRQDERRERQQRKQSTRAKRRARKKILERRRSQK